MIIKLLQENAEWMCAIAIVIFTGVQCWLAYQQNMQNIKMKRLELANKLDQTITVFMGSNDEANEVMNWLSANASNFSFLLNNCSILLHQKQGVLTKCHILSKLFMYPDATLHRLDSDYFSL